MGTSVPQTPEDVVVIALELFIDDTKDSLAELDKRSYTYRKLRWELKLAEEALKSRRNGT